MKEFKILTLSEMQSETDRLIGVVSTVILLLCGTLAVKGGAEMEGKAFNLPPDVCYNPHLSS